MGQCDSDEGKGMTSAAHEKPANAMDKYLEDPHSEFPSASAKKGETDINDNDL